MEHKWLIIIRSKKYTTIRRITNHRDRAWDTKKRRRAYKRKFKSLKFRLDIYLVD